MELVFSDVNEAYASMAMMARSWKMEDTRNGPAAVCQDPVTLIHTRPHRRVLFDKNRDANPFFHYMEAIWMLAGADDVEFLSKFSSNIKNYSDNGHTLRGAYGYRWRHYFQEDQLEEAIRQLKEDPTTRRVVLQMWDVDDLTAISKDKPCNTHIYLRVVDGRLRFTVCNRSNDLVWGMLGANIVHFSIAQEYIANSAGLGIESLVQFSNNVHVYKDWLNRFSPVPNSWYSDKLVFTRMKFSDQTFDMAEARRFIRTLGDGSYKSPIFRLNAMPMVRAFEFYKSGNWHVALQYLRDIYDADWREACFLWLTARKESRG